MDYTVVWVIGTTFEMKIFVSTRIMPTNASAKRQVDFVFKSSNVTQKSRCLKIGMKTLVTGLGGVELLFSLYGQF